MKLLRSVYRFLKTTPIGPCLIAAKEFLPNLRKRRLGSAKRRNKQLAKLRTIMKERPVKVAFQIAQLSKWKSESVLQCMMHDPQFEPMMWIVPAGGELAYTTPALHAQQTALIHEHFDSYGIPVVEYRDVNAFPPAEHPDIVFIHEPYDAMFDRESYRGLKKEILCHVPYCFHNTADIYEYDGVGNNAVLFNFYENSNICALGATIAQNKGINNIATGNPQADIFLDEAQLSASVWKDCGHPMKKVIWAPHWTIAPGLCWFTWGTFLTNAQAMVELAQKYADRIQFAFKPHPHLYRVLISRPDWGKEKTDAYYKLWAEMPNTQLAEGDYTALIMQSDAMIHDSGSFILENLFADKPAMFLREGEGYENYNEMTLDALKCYHKGLTKEDIEDFLQRCVLGTEDPLAEIRHDILKKYLLPPNGKTAAENIVDTLKNV